MSSRFGFRAQMLVAFLASLYVGLRAARAEGGSDSVKKNVLTNLVSTVGLLAGYRLATRRRESATRESQRSS